MSGCDFTILNTYCDVATCAPDQDPSNGFGLTRTGGVEEKGKQKGGNFCHGSLRLESATLRGLFSPTRVFENSARAKARVTNFRATRTCKHSSQCKHVQHSAVPTVKSNSKCLSHSMFVGMNRKFIGQGCPSTSSMMDWLTAPMETSAADMLAQVANGSRLRCVEMARVYSIPAYARIPSVGMECWATLTWSSAMATTHRDAVHQHGNEAAEALHLARFHNRNERSSAVASAKAIADSFLKEHPNVEIIDGSVAGHLFYHRVINGSQDVQARDLKVMGKLWGIAKSVLEPVFWVAVRRRSTCLKASADLVVLLGRGSKDPASLR